FTTSSLLQLRFRHANEVSVRVKCLLCVLSLGIALTACRAPAAQTSSATAAAGGVQGSGAATAPAPPKPVPAQLPAVIARVNGEDVKEEDLERMNETRGARRPPHSARSPRRDPARRHRSARRLYAAQPGEQDARHQGRRDGDRRQDA